MKHLYLVVSALIASGSVLAAPSNAVLVDANGSVMVNHGKQFVSAKSGQLLTVGDRVMVMEGANASVRFADGCVLPLNGGSLVSITAQSTCVSGQSSVAQIAPMNANASDDGDCDNDGIKNSEDPDIDDDGTANAVDNYNACEPVAGNTNNAGIWIAGATAAIAAGYAINKGDDKTVSP